MAEEIKVSYVKQKITDALLHLMKQHSFSEITITQIVQTAGVGRASFYRNYKDKEDVLTQHMAVLIQKWGREFEQAGKPNIIESLLEHYYAERDFYKLLYESGLSYHMLDTIKAACEIDKEEENISAYLKAWFAGGLFCWVSEWIKRGMAETPETMLRLLAEREDTSIG
ncbi:MAG: TetR/AcrR family transcriptional regulator [Oscillospiraceae bacterium]